MSSISQSYLAQTLSVHSLYQQPRLCRCPLGLCSGGVLHRLYNEKTMDKFKEITGKNRMDDLKFGKDKTLKVFGLIKNNEWYF